MKLLYDQNLPRGIVRQLAEFFPDSKHVIDVGLETSDDREIWKYAENNAYTIVSKDSDFHTLSQMFGFPPKFVWLRYGNVDTYFIRRALEDNRHTILRFIKDQANGLLILR